MRVRQLILDTVLCYLIGSINGAYTLVKLLFDKDIRDYGSGNPGSTNVYRVFGLNKALISFAFDTLKGFLAIKLSDLILPGDPLARALAALAVVAGHDFSFLLGHNGGKGVATSFGIGLALTPGLTCCGAALSAVLLIMTRLMSLSNMISMGVLAAATFILRYPTYISVLYTILFIAACIRHKSNIQRLLNGTENKIEFPHLPHKDK